MKDMKYLKRFNENSDLYDNTISDCKDILLDLTDIGIRCDVNHFDNVDKFKIEIEASEQSKVRLGDFGSSFEHLLSYLESKGYILDSKGSFYENENWDSYEECPECGSNNVSHDSFTNGERNWGSNYKCGKCDHVGDVDNFQSPGHPISKSELLNSIRNNYHIDFMYLIFKSV